LLFFADTVLILLLDHKNRLLLSAGLLQTTRMYWLVRKST